MKKRRVKLRELRARRGVVHIGREALRRRLRLQFKQAAADRLEKKHRKDAIEIRKKFRAEKADRGNFVLAGLDGGRNPQRKGRKGVLLYITRTGKKWLVGQRGIKDPYQPRRIREVSPPETARWHKKAQAFNLTKRKLLRSGRAIRKGKGAVNSGGAWDFSDKVQRRIARDIKRQLETSAAKRSYLLRVMVLIRLPNGTSQTLEFSVGIARRDHLAIELGGIENFVRQRFYAMMARELAYAGFVSSGSANHIRKLAHNKGRKTLLDADGEDEWRGNGLEIVTIERIEWRYEQANGH